MAGPGGSSLEDLLLGDLHVAGVYDLAADLGIVQHGQLHEPGHDGWAHGPTGLSPPPPPMPPSGLTPPPPAGLPQPEPPSLAMAGSAQPLQLPLLRHRVDPAELEAAEAAVSDCLAAADAATVALRVTRLQLEQWAAREAGAAAAGDAPASPSRAAAAALDSLHAEQAGTSAAAADPAAAKRKRSGSRRSGGGAGAGPSSAAGAADDAGGKAGGKGLRHFSLKVCEKVESMGDTSYEEVANGLIADLAAEVAAGLAEQVHDEKNIRRRVYDALNVLEAVGMIDKNKKAIKWRGWPSGRGRATEDRLRAERGKARERLEELRRELEDAVRKAYCLSNLALRNRDAPLPLLEEMRAAGVGVPNPLTLPFMLVQADAEAEVEVEISEDNLHAHIDFAHWPFVLFDDDHVMRMLNLHLPQPQLYAGLRRGQVAQAARTQEQQEQQGQAAAAPRPQQPQAQAQQQQPAAVKREPQRPAGRPPPAPAPLTTHQQLSASPPEHSQQQQQQQQRVQQAEEAAQAAGEPRVTPPRRPPQRRLPTPALQLSPAISSPGGLGTSVSAMDLGSPPATTARTGVRGAFLRPQQQAGQLSRRPQQPLLRPAEAAPAALTAPGGLSPDGGLGEWPSAWAPAAPVTAAPAFSLSSAIPPPHPQLMRAPAPAGVPQLRPAVPAAGGWHAGLLLQPALVPAAQPPRALAPDHGPLLRPAQPPG